MGEGEEERELIERRRSESRNREGKKEGCKGGKEENHGRKR